MSPIKPSGSAGSRSEPVMTHSAEKKIEKRKIKKNPPHLKKKKKNNVPPRLRDGDAKGRRVGVPPNFRNFWEMGDGDVTYII
jgi:hypothetical protein